MQRQIAENDKIMEAHKLMKLLVPESKVKDVYEFTGLKPSLLYQERRKAGKEKGNTGTRNTIDRLDLFCEFNLDDNAEVVRMVGERYLRMYENHVNPLPENLTLADLFKVLGEVGKECGDVLGVMSERQTLENCTVEVSQAKAKLEYALRIFAALECQK